jgi:hypothetical protein
MSGRDPGSRRVGSGLLVGLLCAAAGAASAAQGEKVRLSWVRGPGAEQCLSGATLAERVAARLGRDAVSEQAPRSIEGVVVREGERFSARIYVRDAGGSLVGQREIDDASPSCGALDAAVVLAVVLAIDPDAALAPPPALAPSTPSPVLPSAPTAAASGAPPDVASGAPAAALPAPSPTVSGLLPAFPAPGFPFPGPAPVRPARSEPSTAFGASSVRVLFAAGLLPAGAFGLASTAEAGVRRLRVAAGVLWFPEVHTADGGFGFGLAAGTLGGCIDPYRSASFRLGLCAGGLAGALHAVTYRLSPTQPGDRPWLALSFGGRAELRLVGPLTLHAGAEAVVPLLRYRFLVLGRAEPVFEPATVAAVAAAGLGVTFP